MISHTCCIFGNRSINETEQLKEKIKQTIELLVTKEQIDQFLFGSKSQFDRLCLQIVTQLKAEKYPHVKRVYVRAEFPVINETYTDYLLQSYDHSYYPEALLGATRSVYVQRNYEMIRKSRFCLVYYSLSTAPTNRPSGTEIALRYAKKQRKAIFLFP